MRGQAAEEMVYDVLQAWAKDKPLHAKEFRELIQQEYEALVTSTGMSRDGHFAYRGQIPMDVYIVIEGKVPGFLRDPKNLILVHKMCMGKYMPKARKVHIIDRS